MTPGEFKQARLTLNQTQNTLADYLKITPRQITRYEQGVSEIPHAIAILLDCLIRKRPPSFPRGKKYRRSS